MYEHMILYSYIYIGYFMLFYGDVSKDHFLQILCGYRRKPTNLLQMKNIKIRGSKCNTLSAHWISNHRTLSAPSSSPSEFESLRHTSSWPGCLADVPQPRIVQANNFLCGAPNTYPTKSRGDQKDTYFFVRFSRHLASSCCFSKVSLAVRQIVADAKQLKTRQWGRPSTAK